MNTIEQAFAIIYDLNEEAYDDAYHCWQEADINFGDTELYEHLVDVANETQAEHFRALFSQLSEDKKISIINWLKRDDNFKEEFRDFYGHYYFDKTDMELL